MKNNKKINNLVADTLENSVKEDYGDEEDDGGIVEDDVGVEDED